MRILFTNDDGVFSPGLLALLSAFQGDGNELLVAAPDAERSVHPTPLQCFPRCARSLL